MFKKPGLAGKIGGDKGNGSDCVGLVGDRRKGGMGDEREFQ